MDQFSKMSVFFILTALVLIVPAKAQPHNMSTHVLNAVMGVNAANVVCELFSITEDDESNEYELLSTQQTDSTGRVAVFLPANQFSPGPYSIRIHAEDYFNSIGVVSSSIFPFFDVEFRIRDTSIDYHIPIVISPFAYTTYRGKIF